MIIPGLMLSACSQDSITIQATPTISPPTLTATMTLEPTLTATATKTIAEWRAVELEYPEFSKYYQPEVQQHYVAYIYGMQIPIDIGLTHRVVSRSVDPIREFQISEDIVPLLGDFYLKSCYYRFTHLVSGNASVTFEQYIELVKQGRGNIDFAVYDEVNNSLNPLVMSIDPRKGYAISFVEGALPIWIGAHFRVYLGNDGDGRLLTGLMLDNYFLSQFDQFFIDYSSDVAWAAIFFNLNQQIMGLVTEIRDCLEYEDVRRTCALRSAPPAWRDLTQKTTDEITKLINGQRPPIISVVIPFGTATPAPTFEAATRHPEFSKRYQPEYLEHYVANIYGLQIPMDLGLTYGVVFRPVQPIKEVHLAEDIVPILGEMYLKVCHYRFTHLMSGNASVTFEQYIELIKQGRGNIDFAVYDEASNSQVPVVFSIDPRMGFAISFVEQSLPIKINDLRSNYYGTDGEGKLFVAERLDNAFLAGYNYLLKDYSSDVWGAMVFGELLQSDLLNIANIDNKCIVSEDVQATCGLLATPPEWEDIIQKMKSEMRKLLIGQRGPVIMVVQE
jgi:ASC-1-like (ASCH) protein